MASATLTRRSTTKPKQQSVRLVEDNLPAALGKVDRQLGIIYHAKLVGLESRNIGKTIGLDPDIFGDAVEKPYGYSKQALESAIPLYEGATVRIDHPATDLDDSGKRVIKQRSRNVLSTGGEIRNVVMEEDGLYGDLHLLLTNPASATILEIADRMPSKIACSHNADGRPVLKNGRAVIDKINRVNSVDIVGDRPGTTNGLFETEAERNNMPRTIKQIIAAIPPKTIGHAFLLEMMDEMYGGAAVAEMSPQDIGGPAMDPGPTAPPTEQVSDALKTVMIAIWDDNTIDAAGKMAKIKELFKLKSKLDGTDSSLNTAPPIEGEESLEESGGDKSTKKDNLDSEDEPEEEEVATEESMAALAKDNPAIKTLLETVASQTKEITALKNENTDGKLTIACRQLLESAEREVSDVRVAALKRCTDDKERKALIEDWPKKETADDFTSRKPARSVPILETAGAAGAQAENAESFARSLRM